MAEPFPHRTTPSPDPPPSVPVVEATDLTFSYGPKADPVISHFTHAFVSGRVTALTGASGCGKSTLLYVLGGLLTPTAGEVRMAGRPFSFLRDGERAARRAASVGFVFQDAMLDPARTVIANVCESAVFAGLDRRLAIDRARGLLHLFGISNRADHRPGEVSGGQAQRVALCRALLTRPSVILADEPTGNLDAESAQVVWSTLRETADAGCCVIVATHSSAIADDADARIDLPTGHS